MEEVLLSNRGEVFSSTAVFLPAVEYKGSLPYHVGQVKLPEGVIVPAMFTCFGDTEPLPIGTRVEMVVEKFKETEEGDEVMTYYFKQV